MITPTGERLLVQHLPRPCYIRFRELRGVLWQDRLTEYLVIGIKPPEQIIVICSAVFAYNAVPFVDFNLIALLWYGAEFSADGNHWTAFSDGEKP